MKNISILFFLLLCAQSFSQPKLNVIDFGAKGDGITDCYIAFKLLADSVNKLKKAEITFPPGIYVIAPYHTRQNKISDIIFTGCNGIKINGNHAVISVNGNFHRYRERFNGKYWYSNTNAIIPLSFQRCENIMINGLEMNGNVNQMTRDSNVVESAAHMIQFLQCRNIELNNLFLHHAQTDGLYIRGDSCYHLVINNTIFSSNGRQGMSVIGLTDGFFNHCRFINTGITEGNYGRHNPSDGVDIEPGSSLVKHLIFKDCEFSNNLGGQFICTNYPHTSDIQLINCKIESGQSKRPSQLIFYADSVLLDHCNIDCGNGALYANWGKAGHTFVTIKNSIIKSKVASIVANTLDSSSKLIVLNDSLICTNQDTLKLPFVNIKAADILFANNTIIYKGGQPERPDLINASIEGNGYYINNKIITDQKTFTPNITVSGLKTEADKTFKKLLKENLH